MSCVLARSATGPVSRALAFAADLGELRYLRWDEVIIRVRVNHHAAEWRDGEKQRDMSNVLFAAFSTTDAITLKCFVGLLQAVAPFPFSGTPHSLFLIFYFSTQSCHPPQPFQKTDLPSTGSEMAIGGCRGNCLGHVWLSPLLSINVEVQLPEKGRGPRLRWPQSTRSLRLPEASTGQHAPP